MTLTTLLALLIKTSLIALMVGLGLGLRLEALAELHRRPWLILRVVLGSCLLVPLVALALLRLPISHQLPAGARFGLALMALCPSAPLTLRNAHLRGGDVHLAAVLQVAAALVAIVSIPLLGDQFRATHHLRGWDISPMQVALQVGLMQVLPLTLGLSLRHWRPALANRWAPPIQRSATLVTLAVVGVILITGLPKLFWFLRETPLTLAALVTMAAAALSLGYGLGGGGRSERITTALVTSMRNPGLALFFALTFGPTLPEIRITIIAYLLVTILVSIPVVGWGNRSGEA